MKSFKLLYFIVALSLCTTTLKAEPMQTLGTTVGLSAGAVLGYFIAYGIQATSVSIFAGLDERDQYVLRDEAIEYLAEGHEGAVFSEYAQFIRNQNQDLEITNQQLASFIIGATAHL